MNPKAGRINHRSLASLFLPVLVLLFSIEIIWRRLIAGQVPTQFPAFVVYGLLVLNVVYLVREWRLFLRRGARVSALEGEV